MTAHAQRHERTVALCCRSMTPMWLFPLLTLGVVSLLTFSQGAIVALAIWTSPGSGSAGIWFPFVLMLLGAAGMWWTVRLTPER